MSYRYTRHQYLEEKKQQHAEKFGVKVRKENPHRVAAYLNRAARRAAIASGLTEAIPTWRWDRGCNSGTVEAHTRSEARARVKEALGINKNHRLPEDVHLTREEPCLV